MDEYFRANREHWDELVEVHVQTQGSSGYNVEAFRRGRTTLLPVELEEVGDVVGKSLLHLQCHFGLDTLSWARRGARVTGADFSEKAIGQARALAADLHIDARFVQANLYDLPRVLDDEFDIVFTSYGVLCWLPDVAAWAQVIARFLRPGGFFYIIEAHPFARVFCDERGVTDLRVWLPYWRGREPHRWESDGTYADPQAKLEHRVTWEWEHTMGEIVNSLIDAGLRIEFLHEFPFCAWDMLPFMVRGDDGYWRLREDVHQIPLLFSLKARKPPGEGASPS